MKAMFDHIKSLVPLLVTVSLKAWDFLFHLPWEEYTQPLLFFIAIFTLLFYIWKWRGAVLDNKLKRKSLDE